MEIRTGTSRRRASSKASSPHSHQSTGLSACWRRYGEAELARRLGMSSTVVGGRSFAPRSRKPEGGSRKAEGGRRKAEGGRRKAEGGSRKSEVDTAAEADAICLLSGFGDWRDSLVAPVRRRAGGLGGRPPARAELGNPES